MQKTVHAHTHLLEQLPVALVAPLLVALLLRWCAAVGSGEGQRGNGGRGLMMALLLRVGAVRPLALVVLLMLMLR